MYIILLHVTPHPLTVLYSQFIHWFIYIYFICIYEQNINVKFYYLFYTIVVEEDLVKSKLVLICQFDKLHLYEQLNIFYFLLVLSPFHIPYTIS